MVVYYAAISCTYLAALLMLVQNGAGQYLMVRSTFT